MTTRNLTILFLALALAGFAFSACDEDTGCTDDYDCAGAMVCVTGSGVCIVPKCTDDAQCNAGKTCEDYICADPIIGG